MSCEDIRNLIPAYTMGTGSSEEIHAVDDHILGCDLHDEIVSSAAVAELIGSAAESMTAPASLKNRVMSHVADSSRNEIVDARNRGSRLYRRGVFAHPIAALLVVAIGAMAVWNIMLQSADSPERFTHYYWGNDNDWMRIETVLGEQGAEVSLGGVERLDGAHIYHLWTTRDENVLLVGSFNVNLEGKWAGEFEFVFEAGDRVWMTLESVDGVDQPTGETVLRTRF